MGDIPATIELEDGWRELKVSALDKLEAIIEGGFGKGRLFTNQEYAVIYTLCYNMCNQKIPCNWSEDLYERHRDTVANYLMRKVRPAVKYRNGEFLLKEFVRRTDNHKVMIKWMSKFFLYLDRHYVSNGQHASVESVGLECFRAIIYEDVKLQVSAGLMLLIKNEREGQVIDRDLIRSCLMVFELMGRPSYVNDFENQFLAETSSFYQAKSAEWIAQDSTPMYIHRVEQCMEDEKGRVSAYMIAACTEQKLVKTMEDTVIIGQVPELLHREGSGCKAMLHNDSLHDLSCMFKLFAGVEMLTPMAEVFKSFVVSIGEARMDKLFSTSTSTTTGGGGGGGGEETAATVTTAGGAEEGDAKSSAKSGKNGKNDLNGRAAAAAEEEAQFVKDILIMHDKYLKMVEDQFSSNVIFQKAFNDAFNHLMNRSIESSCSSSGGGSQGTHKMAEMLCSFCDRLLKTGSSEKIESDEQAEFILNNVVQLFFYLQDKDVFAEIYRNQLAKRLLNQRSASDELERFFVGRLKMKCGAQFTSKLEGMLSDLSLVAEHMHGFQELFAEQQAVLSPSVAAVDYNVQLLTAGYWPTYKSFDVTLPPVMQRCTEIFKEFYDAKNPQRRLQWVHTLGSVTMKCTFGSKSYDIQVSTLQAAVLCSFPAAAGNSADINKKNTSDATVTVASTASAATTTTTTVADNDNGSAEPECKKMKVEEKEDDQEATTAGAKVLPPVMEVNKKKTTPIGDSKGRPIPYSDLLDSLGMSEETLKRVLHSLSCGKFRVLKKISNHEGSTGGGDKIIRPTDSFQVNDKFASPVRKFRIPMANLDESANEKRVEEDRTTAIEAAIVRIMKARKTLAHQQLVAEVLTQLIFFRPNPKAVKRRIEALIDREYLERDEDNPTMYKYLA